MAKEENLLVEHATDYYKKLFGPSVSPSFKIVQIVGHRRIKIYLEESDWLTSNFLRKK
jgi:hypothetical protein